MILCERFTCHRVPMDSDYKGRNVKFEIFGAVSRNELLDNKWFAGEFRCHGAHSTSLMYFWVLLIVSCKFNVCTESNYPGNALFCLPK